MPAKRRCGRFRLHGRNTRALIILHYSIQLSAVSIQQSKGCVFESICGMERQRPARQPAGTAFVVESSCELLRFAYGFSIIFSSRIPLNLSLTIY
jgi:hypothetical protein